MKLFLTVLAYRYQYSTNKIIILNCIYCFLFYEDSNFSWANAGATVFGSAVTSAPKNNGDEEGSDEEEAPNNVDIHFEPIVSLPEVPFKILPSYIFFF